MYVIPKCGCLLEAWPLNNPFYFFRLLHTGKVLFAAALFRNFVYGTGYYKQCNNYRYAGNNESLN